MKKIPLQKPIDLGDGKPAIESLNLREEICAGDIRGVKMALLADGDIEPLLKIAARLSGQPDAVISKLGLKDTELVCEIVRGFMEAGQETGPTV